MAVEQTGDETFRQVVEAHERALRVHCYRLLGSLQDAEDLTQETLLRAWRSLDSLVGQASLRAWLYRIATNACLDEIDKRARRVLPVMIGSPRRSYVPSEPRAGDAPWLDPLPDAWLDVADTVPGPEAQYDTRESIELAFVAALQLLPGRQRAVLLLRDVLGWSTPEVAEMLELSIAATQSLLQRARETLGKSHTRTAARLSANEEQILVARYLRAWEHADVDALVALLKDDARLSMPPLPEWYAGIEAIGGFLRWALGPDGMGPYRLVQTRANGSPAFGIYARGEPVVVHVVEADREGIFALTSFMDPRLFGYFGLPA
jgi:RNA polymerase sigma-70 factor (ECF subfamily)